VSYVNGRRRKASEEYELPNYWPEASILKTNIHNISD
jgi:hypothetical protein